MNDRVLIIIFGTLMLLAFRFGLYIYDDSQIYKYTKMQIENPYINYQVYIQEKIEYHKVRRSMK